jgi:hypothetical protein
VPLTLSGRQKRKAPMAKTNQIVFSRTSMRYIKINHAD